MFSPLVLWLCALINGVERYLEHNEGVIWLMLAAWLAVLATAAWLVRRPVQPTA